MDKSPIGQNGHRPGRFLIQCRALMSVVEVIRTDRTLAADDEGGDHPVRGDFTSLPQDFSSLLQPYTISTLASVAP